MSKYSETIKENQPIILKYLAKMKSDDLNSGKAIGQRVIEVMKDMNYSPSKFASKIGVSRLSINNIVDKGSAPSFTLIDNLCRVFPVSKSWLLTGEGNKFTQDDISEYLYKKRRTGEYVNPEINNRVRIIREDLQLSQTLFASEIRMPRHIIANIENNKQNINVSFVEIISKKFNVNPTWFILGIGNRYLGSKG